jgi:CheY-like chemotaxis protein
MRRDTSTILVVEDDFFNAEYLKEVLLKTPYKVLFVGTGEDALSAIERNSIDLILMDVRLPDINGLETTKRIKESHPAIKIIIQTAFATNLDKENAFKAGCDGYISKPIFKKALIELIESVLYRPNPI